MTTHTRKGYERTTTRHGRVITGKSEDGRALRTNVDMVTFWIEGLYEREPQGYHSAPSSSSIIVQGDSIYSFGTHFEMARIIRHSNGKPRMILTSADTWSSQGWGTTGNHQGYVRHAVSEHNGTLGLPVLEVPFSALNAAGIDLSSIRPLEIRDSHYTYHEISSTERPGALGYVLDEEGNPKYIGVANEGDDRERLPNYSVVDYEKSGMAHAQGTGKPAELREDGMWHWTVQRHWMGDSIFRAQSTETRRRTLTKSELELRDEWVQYLDAVTELDTRWRDSYVQGTGYEDSWHDCRERLRAECAELQSKLPPAIQVRGNEVSFKVTRWATYLSSFDYNERHRPYFLCELPHGCKATTVEEGFDALMPMQVRMHIELGDDVKRQGDVYAIATKFTTAELESLAMPVTVRRFIRLLDQAPWGEYEQVDVVLRKRGAKKDTYPTGSLDIFGSNHQVTHLIVTRDGRYFGRGRMVHAPSHRDADHAVVKLEEGVWYEFIKNTVPTMHTRNGARQTVGGSVFQSGQSRAWAVGGGVD